MLKFKNEELNLQKNQGNFLLVEAEKWLREII
jgi:hypothetical protein